jgi:hypothetical protein
MPYGSLVGNNGSAFPQDTDVDMEVHGGEQDTKKPESSPSKKAKDSKEKKRKVEGDSPKKHKKAKVVA